MRAIGEFVFKGLEKKDGGEFVNERGKSIKYDGSYVVKVDEIFDDNISERKFKVDLKNTGLIDRLKKLKPYDKVKLECDIVIYQNSAKVIPIAICDSNNK